MQKARIVRGGGGGVGVGRELKDGARYTHQHCHKKMEITSVDKDVENWNLPVRVGSGAITGETAWLFPNELNTE